MSQFWGKVAAGRQIVRQTWILRTTLQQAWESQIFFSKEPSVILRAKGYLFSVAKTHAFCNQFFTKACKTVVCKPFN